MRALAIWFVLLLGISVAHAWAGPAEKQPPLLRPEQLPVTLTERGVELTIESVRWEWAVEPWETPQHNDQRLTLKATLRDPKRPDRIWVPDYFGERPNWIWVLDDSGNRVGYSRALLEGGVLSANLGTVDPRRPWVECELRLLNAAASDADRGVFEETLTFAGLPFPTSKAAEKLDIRQRTKQGSDIIIAAVGKQDYKSIDVKIEVRYAIIARPPEDDPARGVYVSPGDRIVDEQGNNIGHSLGNPEILGIEDGDPFAAIMFAEPRTLGQRETAVDLGGKPVPSSRTITMELDVREQIPWRAKPETERRFRFRVAVPKPLPPQEVREPLMSDEQGGVRVSVERFERDLSAAERMMAAQFVLRPPADSPPELAWDLRLVGEDLPGGLEWQYWETYWHADSTPLAPTERAWLVRLDDPRPDESERSFLLLVRRQARAQEEIWLRDIPMPRPSEMIEPKIAVQTKLGATIELARIVYYVSDESLLALNPNMERVSGEDGVAIELRVRDAGPAVAALAARCGIALPPQGKPTVTASIRPVLRDAYPSEWRLGWASSESVGIEGGELIADIWQTLEKPNPHANSFDLKVTLTLATPREDGPVMTFVGVPITNVNRALRREVEDGGWAN